MSNPIIEAQKATLPPDDPFSTAAQQPAGAADAMGTPTGVAFGDQMPNPNLRLASKVKYDWRMAANYKLDVESEWQKCHDNFRGTAPRPMNEQAMRLRSRVTMKSTRVKVAAAIARHKEIGFKWNLKPTAAPLLWEHSEADVKNYLAEAIASMENKDLAAIVAREMDVDTLKEEAHKLAIDRANRMKTQIKDDLQECRFDGAYEQGLIDFCLYGSMVFKGPFTKKNAMGRFMRKAGGWHYFDQDGLVTYRPDVGNVSVWDWYPSPGAWCVEKLDYAVERHVVNSAELVDLIDGPGFRGQEILAALRDKTGSWVAEPWEVGIMGSNKQQDPTGISDRHTILEWWGYFKVSELEEYGGQINKVKRFDPKVNDIVEVTPGPDEVVIANVWVCGDHVLKAWTADLKPKRLPYYIVPYEKVPKRMFGQGPAWMMEDWQAVINTVYRAMIDNMGMSALPLGWIDKSRVKSQTAELHTGKMFISEGNENFTLPPVQFFAVPNNTAQMKMIADIAKANIQEATSMPDMVQGMMGPGGHNRTSSGLSILGGWADASTRSVQRNVDSECTRPLIRAMYFWEMQLSANDAIKGDMEVEALGVDSVMQEEVITQRLTESMVQINQDPEAEIILDKTRIYKFYFEKLGFKDEGFLRTEAEQKNKRDEIMKAEQQKSDMAAESAAKFQPKMTPEDAALKFFSEIPDEALAYKLAAARVVAGILKIESPEMETALNESLKVVAEDMANKPSDADAAMLEHTDKMADRASKEKIAAMKPAPSPGGGSSKKANGPARISLPAAAEMVRKAGAKTDGRDTELIHATIPETDHLEAMGGSGKRDPKTGLRHFGPDDEGSAEQGGTGGTDSGADRANEAAGQSRDRNAERAAPYGQDKEGLKEGKYGPEADTYGGGGNWGDVPSDVRPSMKAFGIDETLDERRAYAQANAHRELANPWGTLWGGIKGWITGGPIGAAWGAYKSAKTELVGNMWNDSTNTPSVTGNADSSGDAWMPPPMYRGANESPEGRPDPSAPPQNWAMEQPEQVRLASWQTYLRNRAGLAR